MADTHRYVGNHPQEVVVGDKVIMAEPGQFLNLSKADLENEHNAVLVTDGLVADLKSLSPAQAPAPQTEAPKGGEDT